MIKISPGLVGFLLLSVAGLAPASSDMPEQFGIEVIASYPHDPGAFTQGLVYHGGYLYESTGRYGASTVRKVDLQSGRVLQIHHLPADRFGEGLAVVGERLIQLTWRSRIGYVYDLRTLKPSGEFYFQSEGWGLTYDGEHLLMSDGSATLYRLDPETFGLIGKLVVTELGQPVSRLNELEFVDGFIYANVWQTTRIAKIHPQNGRVVGWIELAALVPPASAGAGVLNGIAYSADTNAFMVTGKLWPRLFVINMIKP
ncbi:MAG TPA: glutaminyl-peptide cyclotransferase [Gammaproteobacteria bacterium]